VAHGDWHADEKQGKALERKTEEIACQKVKQQEG